MAVTGIVTANGHKRKKVVVVGLGMVGISFIEKLLKFDAETKQYEIVVIGEEKHVAYNRVALTSYFKTRVAEDLYMSPQQWYDDVLDGALTYHLNTLVTEIDTANKLVTTANKDQVSYDILVLATGSTAILPKMPGWNATGVFVYRTIDDLENLINFSATKKGKVGIVVGGGLLGLEAAKAMMDLNEYSKVTVIESMPYVLGRQLDAEGGMMVVEQVKALGVDMILGKMVNNLLVDADGNVAGVEFKDGSTVEGSCVCFAIGVRARDDLAKQSGITCAERGGVIVDDSLLASSPDVYAIGECANWGGMCYGLIGPGWEMAELLAFNLTKGLADPSSAKIFADPDLSTKLKLLGVNVASFGDCFADVFGPKWLPDDGHKAENAKSLVKALTFKDPFSQVYKKYLFSADGKYLLGGMMMGDTSDYVRLLPMAKSRKPLEVLPSELMVGKVGGGAENPDDLPDEAQICSCNNVSKGDITSKLIDGSCKTMADIKSCTKAGTGCGGCVPLVQTIFNTKMAELGNEVSTDLCSHFPYSRADLFNIIMVKELESFESILKECGNESAQDSLGCEICKPAIASIISSLFNKHIIDPSRKGLQDTNDKFLANIQRNGTFSVVPRMAAGEVTPAKLAVIARVAEKYGLYCKVTGGQRIDMFGAKKQDLLAIWTELIEGGMESGHAYAKSLRTVKSCVGTTWCRFGIGDSVGMAVRIEERYKSIRAPHKIKGGVSGCVRECAEAQNKDFGLIATDKGFNVYVGGNGGAKPRHSELLAVDVKVDDVIPLLDRYLAFYIRTADRLQRTARWIENLPDGINYLRQVILEDKLGICKDLERQMEQLVSTYFCEWTETLKDPVRRKQFQQFANVSDTVETIEPIVEREQTRPANWPKESAQVDFKNIKWTSMAWQPLLEASELKDIATGDSQQVKRGDTQLAIYKVRGKYYCTQNMCGHKRAFVLSDGLIGEANGQHYVACPLHKRTYVLGGEDAGTCGNDNELSIATFPVEERDDGWIYAQLPPVEELDAALGTEKWKIKKGEAECNPFEKVDEELKTTRERKDKRNGSPVNAKNGSKENGIDW